ncbi:MAG: hypothetical protein IT260_09305 [Saprospiraceae bacterium]|nr:hypothetical protein [Saprospiraceae bacterium]
MRTLLDELFTEISTTPTTTSTTTSAPLGRLIVPAVPAARKPQASTYSFTQEDALWLLRFILGEVGGRTDANSAAVVWAMFNRFGLFRHLPDRSWQSFAVFLQKYSTTLQPFLNSYGATRRVYAANRDKGVPIVTSPDNLFYVKDGRRIDSGLKKVQYRKHVDLQNLPWTATSWNGSPVPPALRQFVLDILSGRIANPGIGIATHFANTLVYYKQNNPGSPSPSATEWERYTRQYATSQRWAWVGPVANLNQRNQNAFFVQNLVRQVPANTVQVLP